MSKVVNSVVARVILISEGYDSSFGIRKVIANHYTNEESDKDVYNVKLIIGIEGSDLKDTFWIYDQNKAIFDKVAGFPEDKIKPSSFIEEIKKPRTLCLCNNGLYYMNWYPPQRGRVPSAQCTIFSFETDNPNNIQVIGDGLWNWKRQSVCINQEGKSVIRGIIVALTDMEKTIDITINGNKWVLAEKSRRVSS
jgi:hypothetical protein